MNNFRELTDAERIITINRVLENTKYGDKEKEFGLAKLTKLKYIETSYPLHDGSITENGKNYRSVSTYLISTIMHIAYNLICCSYLVVTGLTLL